MRDVFSVDFLDRFNARLQTRAEARLRRYRAQIWTEVLSFNANPTPGEQDTDAKVQDPAVDQSLAEDGSV